MIAQALHQVRLVHGCGCVVDLDAVIAELERLSRIVDEYLQFARMPRLVREIASKLGKSVRLVMSGEQTEVDKTVIEELEPGAADRRAAAGYGWQRYPELAAANEHLVGQMSAVLYPRARYLLPLGMVASQAGTAIQPGDLVPAYLRSKVAEKPSTGKT